MLGTMRTGTLVPRVAKHLRQDLERVELSQRVFDHDAAAPQMAIVGLLLLRQRVIAPRLVGLVNDLARVVLLDAVIAFVHHAAFVISHIREDVHDRRRSAQLLAPLPGALPVKRGQLFSKGELNLCLKIVQPARER